MWSCLGTSTTLSSAQADCQLNVRHHLAVEAGATAAKLGGDKLVRLCDKLVAGRNVSKLLDALLAVLCQPENKQPAKAHPVDKFQVDGRALRSPLLIRPTRSVLRRAVLRPAITGPNAVHRDSWNHFELCQHRRFRLQREARS